MITFKRAAVEREERDTDGYWIYLRPGYRVGGEDAHAIVEDTKKQARAKLKWVVECRCRSCRKALAGNSFPSESMEVQS